MSYSFIVTADTKDDAGKKVEEQLGQVVASQPSHEFDRQVAQNAAEGFIDVLADPKEGEEIYVSVVGSLSWSGDPAPNVFSNASVSVHASVRTKAA